MYFYSPCANQYRPTCTCVLILNAQQVSMLSLLISFCCSAYRVNMRLRHRLVFEKPCGRTTTRGLLVVSPDRSLWVCT